MPHASFGGLRVLSLESRRAREVEKLITTYNGVPTVVPAMRELPMGSNAACIDFGRGLLAGDFDLVVFLTGVGVRTVMSLLFAEFDREEVLGALRRTEVVARGMKPLSALRELGIPVTATVPEPSTWRELVTLLDTTYGERLAGFRVAVQEYGATNPELLADLVTRSAAVTKVPVYQWGLPLDLGPLRGCVRAMVHGSIDVVIFMTAVQVIHLFLVAEEMGLAEELRRGIAAVVVVSIGPTTTEELQHYGITPDFEPSRPRMGFLINEAAQYAGTLLAAKRAAPAAVESSASPVMTARSNAAVPQVAVSTSTMAGFRNGLARRETLPGNSGRKDEAGVALRAVLGRVVEFVTLIVSSDACFLYLLEGETLVLRAVSPHAAESDRLRRSVGEGIAGWVAEHRESVALQEKAGQDPRFRAVSAMAEDGYEAVLAVPMLSADRLVGVLAVQHRAPHVHSFEEHRRLSTFGELIGAEIERAWLMADDPLSSQVESGAAVTFVV